MSNIINSIQVSGVNYTLSATSSGGTNAVEVTQAEYDALVSGGTVDPTVFYIITDAQPADMSQYWTSAQTNSAITEATSGKADTSAVTESINAATSGKVDTSTFNTYSGNVETALSGKQDTLSAGTGIDITDNVISATGGGGGGKAIEAGRGISITTGETADTVSFNLPIYSGTGEGSVIGGFSGNTASGKYSFALGGRYEGNYDYQYCKATGKGAISFGGTASGQGAFSCGENPQALGSCSVAFGNGTKAIGVESFVIGRNTSANTWASFAQGNRTKTTNEAEVALGEYNNSVSGSSTFGNSGNTLFSVGNGTSNSARHNAFEIRQNGDIYITSGGTDIKLQDNLGGGGGGSITIDPSLDSGSTNAVANSAITAAINAKQDTLSAGTGISIVDNVISATGGGGITSGEVQSMIDESLSGKQDVLSAGTGISIVDNVISATGGGGGGSITIDPSLDSGSTNAVANSAVSAALNYDNKFLYGVYPKRTFDNHPTGVIQLRWRNPYNGSSGATQDAISLVKINNIPLIEDYVSGIYNLNLVETSAITTSISSSSTDSQVPSAKAVYDTIGNINTILESI